jgi:hypothetical protein
MRFFRTLACLAFAAAFIGSAAAEVPREDVRAFMEKSGMVAQFSGGSDEVRESFTKEFQGKFPPDLIGPLTEVIVEAVDGRKFLDAVETAYSEALTPEDIAAANAFLGTPLGQRLVEAEIAGGSPEAQKEIETRRKELVAGLEGDKARMAVVQRVDTLLHATDVGATAMTTFLRAIMIASAGNADPETFARAEQMLELVRPKLIEEQRASVLASFAYTYRDFSLDEFRAYADFLGTAPAQSIYGIFFAVVNEHNAMAGEEIGEGMAALLKQKRS